MGQNSGAHSPVEKVLKGLRKLAFGYLRFWRIEQQIILWVLGEGRESPECLQLHQTSVWQSSEFFDNFAKI